jgi:uncharacterized membrane protein
MTKKMRYDRLDVARGAAFMLMLAHHVWYFVDFSKTAGLDAVGARDASVGGVGPVASACGWVARHAFILIAGFALGTQIRASESASESESESRSRALRRRLVRCVEIGGHAALVSLVTYFAIPGAWVRFGILHFLCVGLSITAVMLSVPRVWGAALGIGVLWLLFRPATGIAWLDTATGARPVGAMIDWFPLRRWLPLLWLGVAVGWLSSSASGSSGSSGSSSASRAARGPKEAEEPEEVEEPEEAKKAQERAGGGDGLVVGLLRFVGRHSLVLYTAHYVALCALVALIASRRVAA